MGVAEDLTGWWVATFLGVVFGTVVFLGAMAAVGLWIAELVERSQIRGEANRFAESVAAGDFDEAEAVAERALAGAGAGTEDRE